MLVDLVFRPTQNSFLSSFSAVSSYSSTAASVAVVRVKFSTLVIGYVNFGGEYEWEYWSDAINDIMLVAISI